ncbi:hypothetical protein GGI04_000845 [Coemansia thaxteri]|uniref:Uncharacterized protein n=1 Tax=Coemansia thaxteri TaxID=2663907 RepID=A0A9W8BCW4_9FUNG|nr:hypothetical protein H4R26_003497 [Coemansia thaxteri]KAJ2008940.1 hypothetical protein GGI04_000845 [Coemansia thaxteri]KAJ2473490.1 hypothetical protein GGI02_000808 [Coemansia sp. RSA 2322]KAJ2482947.1 hypothetical protein EV174_003080 [Coemansia sp. RSA 2320]
MLRHPPASLVVTHKDVDELAAMQRKLLEGVQSGKSQAMTPAGPDQTLGKSAAPAPRGASRQVTFDAREAERQRRQQMTVAERLGL